MFKIEVNMLKNQNEYDKIEVNILKNKKKMNILKQK